MRCVCRHCGEVHRNSRSSHLARKHGVVRSSTMVAENYLRPADLGLSEKSLENYKDGDFLPYPYWTKFPLDDTAIALLKSGEWFG